MKSDVASFIDVRKLLKRTAPENLNVFFPSVNLGFGRSMSFLCLVLSCFSGLASIVLLFVLLFSQHIREDLVRAAYRPSVICPWSQHDYKS